MFGVLISCWCQQRINSPARIRRFGAGRERGLLVITVPAHCHLSDTVAPYKVTSVRGRKTLFRPPERQKKKERTRAGCAPCAQRRRRQRHVQQAAVDCAEVDGGRFGFASASAPVRSPLLLSVLVLLALRSRSCLSPLPRVFSPFASTESVRGPESVRGLPRQRK